jgi:hypothetical protein
MVATKRALGRGGQAPLRGCAEFVTAGFARNNFPGTSKNHVEKLQNFAGGQMNSYARSIEQISKAASGDAIENIS